MGGLIPNSVVWGSRVKLVHKILFLELLWVRHLLIVPPTLVVELLVDLLLVSTKLFLLVEESELLHHISLRVESLEDLEHLVGCLRVDLLAVTALASGFVFIELVGQRNEGMVWDVLDEDPFNVDASGPSVRLLPKVLARNRFCWAYHSGHTAEFF